MIGNHAVIELEVNIKRLQVLLSICSPSQKLTLTRIEGDLAPDQLELIRNLKVNEINFESLNVTSALLDQVNSLPHQNRFVTGSSLCASEEWSNQKFRSYRHLFREGKEPVIR